MKIKIHSIPDERLSFEGTNEKGHKLLFSGNEEAVRPMESVLMAMAACSCIDIELILKKMHQDVQKIEVDAEAERAEHPPRIFTKIKLNYTISGDVKDEKVKKAIDMSINTYCSVSKMIEKSAEVVYTYKVLPV